MAKLGTATDLTADEAATALARISEVTKEGIGGVENYANVVVALVVALATPLAVSRASWSASLPLVGWLATTVLVYLVVLRDRGLS